MSPVTVEPVERRGDLRRFVRLPRSLYPPDSRWVSSLDFERMKFLDRRKNPFFSFAEMQPFLARDSSGREVGRIAAIVNPRHSAQENRPVGFFGFFDAPDDLEVSNALFAAAEAWLRARGLNAIQGPFNPSSNHECGLLVSGFDRPPRIMMAYNHPYYARLIEAAGYRKTQDLVAYEYETERGAPDRLLNALELIKKRGGFTIRPVDFKKFDEEIERLKLIYNEGWSRNYGFVPFTDGELSWMARELKPLITADMCQFAEVDGEPAGVMLILPDLNQALKPLRGRLLPFGWWKLLRGLKRVDAMRAVLMGSRPAYRKRGIDYAFYYEGLLVAKKHRFREIELSWVLESNVELLRPLIHFGARETKRYRLYEKALA